MELPFRLLACWGLVLACLSAVPADAPPEVPLARAPDLLATSAAESAAKPAESGPLASWQAQHEAARNLGLPLEVRTRRLGLVMRLVPPGRFTMGSPRQEPGRHDDETAHPVTLTRGFYCGKFEFTQDQWWRVMQANPSHFQQAGALAPVEKVSWDDAQAMLARLAALEEVPVGTYRLLSEAEWEYACRAGSEAALYTGPMLLEKPDKAPELLPLAWCNLNSQVSYDGAYVYDGWAEIKVPGSRFGTHPVGGRQPNAFGLHDMLGNVAEWCQDWEDFYPRAAVSDPTGPATGSRRVLRGGSWCHYPAEVRCASRLDREPGTRAFDIGLRVARSLP